MQLPDSPNLAFDFDSPRNRNLAFSLKLVISCLDVSDFGRPPYAILCSNGSDVSLIQESMYKIKILT